MKTDKNYKMKKELKTLLSGISDKQQRSDFKKMMIGAQIFYENTEKNRSKGHKESNKE
jgi:hypothetical protein